MSAHTSGTLPIIPVPLCVEEEKKESGRCLKFYVPARDARTMLTSVLQITHCD